MQRALFLRRFFDELVQTGFLAGGGILLDNAFRRGLVERFDSGFQIGLRFFGSAGFHGFARFLDGVFGDAFHAFVADRFPSGNAHVFFGGCLNRHTGEK